MSTGAVADLRAIFVECDVTDPVELVLDAPVAAAQFERTVAALAIRCDEFRATRCGSRERAAASPNQFGDRPGRRIKSDRLLEVVLEPHGHRGA